MLATGLNGVISGIATVSAVMFIYKWRRVKILLVGGTGMGVTMLLDRAFAGRYAIILALWHFPQAYIPTH